MAKVYIKTDNKNRITAISSFAFLADIEGWTLIDEGEGDRFIHAQGNYFPLPLMTDNGAYRYEFIGGVPAERSAEQIAEDEAAALAVPAQPSAEERLAALEVAMLEMIIGGVTG